MKKNFSFKKNAIKSWDIIYLKNKHLSIWPWSDVVSYVSRYCSPRNRFNKILELGCGAGANIPFFLKNKYKYFGIDGSNTIIKMLKKKYPIISNNFLCKDFTIEIPINKTFDFVLDRGAITCNDTTSIKRTLHLIKKKLRPNGIFIGIDWMTENHSSSLKGIRVDNYTRANIRGGVFSNQGTTHFFTRKHLCNLLVDSGFKLKILELKESKYLVGRKKLIHSAFNFLAIRI
jgi:SAM-dependent methyltransferase